MKHRFPIILSIILVSSLILGACSTSSPDSVVEPNSSDTGSSDASTSSSTEPVKITVMSFFAIDNPEVEQGVVDAFEAANPDIKVDLQQVPLSDIMSKFKTLIAGNAAPDVMSMNFDNSYQFGKLGALEPLDPWISKSGVDLNIYYPAIVNMFRVDGVLYSMPATFSDVVLYYNKDLFDAAGLEYPQRDWTMEDMKTAAMALTQDTNGDGKIDQWGYSFPWWPLLLEMYNATIWNEDATACTLNSPQGIKAIQTVVDGRYVDKYAPDADQLAEQGEWDMFIAGKLAMYPTGPWAVQPFNDSITGFTYDIAHMPAGDKQATHVYANAYAMSASSKNKEAAWKFIQYATGPEGTKLRQAGKYEISPVKDIAETYYVEALKGQNPEHSIVFMEVQDYAVPQPVHERWQEIHDSVWPEIELAMNNNKPVEDALNTACENANKILGE
jgi:multiple sugar transport system substrate-binding protein